MKKNNDAAPGDTTPGFVYILRCSDDTLYTGWTNDIVRRLRTHRSGKASKYTRNRLPVELVYLEKVTGRGPGLSREARIKKLSRKSKLELIGSDSNIAGSIGDQTTDRTDGSVEPGEAL